MHFNTEFMLCSGPGMVLFSGTEFGSVGVVELVFTGGV